MPLTPFSGQLGIKRAAHLLRRATFGPSKQQIDSFKSLTAASAMQALYRTGTPAIPSPPIDLKTGSEWMTAGITDANSKGGELEDFYKAWFVGQMMNSSLLYSAREKIVYFLHTHFTAITSKISSSQALYFQNQLFRLYALDGNANAKTNFKELTKKVSVDNAMIRLLDNNQNVNGNPNENYARELHELYTTGRGLEGSLPPSTEQGDYIIYKELDVQEAARVLSGWNDDSTFKNIDPDTGLPRGVVKGSATSASSHDNKPKTFSNHFNNNTIQANATLLSGGNPTEASMLDEIDQLIEQIYNNPETAKNICRKVYRFFVYHDITADIDSTIIQEMADTFKASNYKLQSVIEDLLQSQHFYDAASALPVDDNFGGIIKSPLELVIGTLRFFDVQLPDYTSSASDFYMQAGKIINDANSMGMSFYEPYDVAGYDAYHQYPIYNRSWITPNNLATRYKYIENLINPASDELIHVDVYSWVKTNISNPTDAEALIVELTNYLLPMQENLAFNDVTNNNLTVDRLNYFLVRLLGLFDKTYWPMLWQDGDAGAPLNALFNAMLQSPEYQLQ